MESAKLHDWLQIVGLAAVVGSLIFVGLQLKQADETALAEMLESSSARTGKHRALIAEHADTWQKACLGSELSEPATVFSGNIYSSYAQSSFNAWELLEETGIGGTSSKYLIDLFAANIHSYPVFRSMALSYTDWL